MKWKQILLIAAVSTASAVGGAAAYNALFNKNGSVLGSAENGVPANYAGFFDGKSGNAADVVDLTKAANATVPAVVHIKTKIPAQRVSNDIPRRRGDSFDEFFERFFDYGPNVIPEQRASGSGVIISEDGYIVTNNHVISGNGDNVVAEEINVTLANRKSYKARLVGRDPSSDLAVLKIEGGKFPFLVYGNSENIQLGQWVLAVGYPLTLETTVTAGIVSATGRSININRRQSETPVESFIQTDAAVNQGNSGGALVDAEGKLIGINSAILAPNGTYAGYSFAIPVTIVRKIVEDIVRYGDVQRGFLGVTYLPVEEMSEAQQRQAGIPANLEGVLVQDVSPEGGASAVGIRKGDIITKVNNNNVLTGLQMSAQLASFRPGDRVPITFIRDGKETNVTVTLRKRPGNTEVAAAAPSAANRLGASLETLTPEKAREYGVPGGVVVKNFKEGGALSRTRISEGYIITSINGREVRSVEDLNKAIGSLKGNVRVEGIYPGYDGVFPYPLRLE